MLAERGVAADTAQFELYRRVALEVLAAPQDQHNPAAEASCAQYLTRCAAVNNVAETSLAVQRCADHLGA